MVKELYEGLKLYDEANGRWITLLNKHFDSAWNCEVEEIEVIDIDGDFTDENTRLVKYEQLFTNAELKHFKIA